VTIAEGDNNSVTTRVV